MQYKALRNIQLDGEIRRVGEVVEINDESVAEKLLIKGSIELTQASPVDMPDMPEPPVAETIPAEEVADIAPDPLADQNLSAQPDPEELQRAFEDTGAISAPSSENTETPAPTPINVQLQ